MKNKYFEVHIPFSKSNFENLENLLTLYGNLTVLEENGSFIVCFPDRLEADELKEYLSGHADLRINNIEIKEFDNKDWNKEWEKSIKPVKIGRKMVVYPSWLKNELGETNDRILIEIDPKMAFGTGHNETTQLMLEMMVKYIDGNEKSLLDYGCGTGVLAIAGIKLGVKNAIAIDNDPIAIENAMECLKKNSVHNSVALHCANIDEIDEENFNVVCANIISSVIIDNIEHIDSKIAKGGKLFVSGVLMDEDQSIMDYLFQNGFDVEDIQNKGEWIGMYAIKR
ncbi:MAG: 50S ribosomal protein L11 methyltransferase [Ignavibacteria bacterium]|nr:50S ribosomal protein L11 methyltransferase [Ignavibacteria bacterium]